MTLAREIGERTSNRRVRLSDAHIEHIYNTVRGTQRHRYMDWLHRHEEMAANREYLMPRISEFYSRALINQGAREALHVTRRAVQAVTTHTIQGSQGHVALLSTVINLLDSRYEEPNTAGWQSLRACKEIITSHSYNISEGPSFVRTPLVIPVLERKYYVDDIENY